MIKESQITDETQHVKQPKLPLHTQTLLIKHNLNLHSHSRAVLVNWVQIWMKAQAYLVASSSFPIVPPHQRLVVVVLLGQVVVEDAVGNTLKLL